MFERVEAVGGVIGGGDAKGGVSLWLSLWFLSFIACNGFLEMDFLRYECLVNILSNSKIQMIRIVGSATRLITQIC